METFLGSIMFFGFNFEPRGWAYCDGRLLSIAQNSALFSLLGTYYGGDGITTFGLPDLRGRYPMGQGQAPGLTPRQMGEVGGVENVTLNQQQMPAHNHKVSVASSSSSKDPANNFVGYAWGGASYETAPGADVLGIGSISQTGGSQPHPNMPPYVVGNWCIATSGIYPSRQ